MNKKMHGRENESVAVVSDVPTSEVAAREEKIQAFWETEDIFNKSLVAPAGAEPKGDYVFYDGPPFATGTPHYGHILAGTIKDAIPRFWTMNGYRVRRKWGWDCHGLPLENLIEKRLGLATKRDIEEYGVQNFNEAARDAVMEYADDWKKVVPRMGRFADMENDYKTMDSTYTESVWWVFSQLHKKGLVFEGFKSMHLCPRCGTTLSNFEVNQGYKDIKDIAVTVKLPLLNKAGEVTDTSLLVWTTTPWTLPGNLAAAVNEEFEYVKVKLVKDGSHVIVAKGRLVQLEGEDFEIVETIEGVDLVGRRYQPPFNYLKNQDIPDIENAWQILHADYVELGEDGTGAVHIAPAYGDDDLKLAQANGVPLFHHVDEAGHFKDFVGDGLAGMLVKPKDNDEANIDHKAADIEVLKLLQASGAILKKENITHSYPHCWRCDTPLLNYATTSWFVDVPKIKDQLVANSSAVKWVPEHVGTNRFGKWLEGARDWAISRQRYWGAPLPIWKNPETGDFTVIGSLKELQEHVPKSGNAYYMMRHGEAESNLTESIRSAIDTTDALTEKGKQQLVDAIKNLKDTHIDLIVASPLMRTKESAQLVKEALGFSDEQLVFDERLIELQAGATLEGKTWSEYQAQFSSEAGAFTDTPAEGENRMDVVRRTADWLFETDKKYQGKNILVVSHLSALFGLEVAAKGLNPEEAGNAKVTQAMFENAEVRELSFTPFPHNDQFELDFHRPYIDNIALFAGETQLVRVPDVFDCWFESGSMPYGQHHFMGENSDEFLKEYFPAQFIAEGIDQTRGWFYSLIVLGTALFGKSPYENVIVTGLVLAEDGKKMSKSLQNYSDPMELVNRTGADAMRLYLLSSPIMRAEDLNFSEKEVLELQRKNIGRLHNVLAMYEMFADGTAANADSPQALDQWIVTRLNELIQESTTGYKNYELDKATRPIGDFVDDLSVWYLRRSRDRFKGEDAADKALAVGTLRYALQQLSLVIAPAMPFYAEYLWQAVRGQEEAQSVHLAAWPVAGPVDEASIEQMEMVREIVTTALEARTKANLKVRQPVAGVTGPTLPEALAQIVLDELNAKKYTGHEAVQVSIDTALTPELIAEGAVRELMRAVQGKRKTDGLQPFDTIHLVVSTSVAGQAVIELHAHLIQQTVGAQGIEFALTGGETVIAGDLTFIFSFTQ